MISKPALNRAQRLREDHLRRRCRRCFDAVVEQLGEAETLGDPVRVGDQVVIPVVRVEVETQDVRPGPEANTLTLTFGEARRPSAHEKPKRGA